MYRLIGITISVAIAFGLAGDAFASGNGSPWAEEAIRLINEEREAKGLMMLSPSGRLSDAAAAKLRDMDEKGYFAHTSPENHTPWDFVDGAGYQYRFAGENLAIHFKDPAREHEAWMKSEKHCQNILDPRFRDIGMAVGKVFFEGRETMLVVSMFGTERGEEVGDTLGKDDAVSMCRGEATPGSIDPSGNDEGRIGLLLRQAEDEFGFLETLAVGMFILAQIFAFGLIGHEVLLRERRDGLFVS